MKTNSIIFLSLLTSAITSCNSGIDQNAKPVSSVQSAGSLASFPTTDATPVINLSDTNKPSTTATQFSSSKTASNPAHGQPGHRCDVTEGASLSNPNSAANNSLSNLITTATPATLQPQSQTPTLSNIQPQLPTSASKTTGAVNPAHGQPGHRCDLTVGAPLSTAATTTATKTSTPVTQQPQNPIANTSQPQVTVPASKTSAGLNPAHGQPGHRCDLTVGAPLTDKPASSTTSSATSSTTPANSSTTVEQPSSSPAPLQVNATQPIKTSPFSASIPQSTTGGQNAKVRLNPAHGQPGHDCSIQAGKPLKQ